MTITAWEALYDRCGLGTDEVLLVHAAAGGFDGAAAAAVLSRLALARPGSACRMPS